MLLRILSGAPQVDPNLVARGIWPAGWAKEGAKSSLGGLREASNATYREDISTHLGAQEKTVTSDPGSVLLQPDRRGGRGGVLTPIREFYSELY